MRIQPIILGGGCCLAFGAAFANTGLLLRTGTSVSHLTGDISKLSIDLVRSSPEVMAELLRVSSAAVAFFVGAFFAGLLIHHPTLDFARPYGRTVTGIGVLFMLSYFLIPTAPVLAISLSAFGCGIQNSLATRYRGIILRTTHLTGLITDFGITLGMRVRGFDVPRWKIAVPGFLTAAFVLGGGLAATLHFWAGRDPILFAGVAYIAAGVIWTVAKHWVFRDYFFDSPGDDGEA
jgi:uncharacterized membrane protein YoaK (UPF0700 family)